VTRLLVVRLGSLGDLVHTLPAVAALRRAHPAAEIDWLVDRVHQPFLALVPPISTVIALANRTAGAWLDVRRRLRARRYDAALDFQGLIKSAVLARWSGAREVAGFARAALREPVAAWFYTRRVPVDDSRHVIWKNLELARAAGAGEPREPFEFPLGDAGSAAIAAFRDGAGAFALINPGAAWPNKRWPPDRLGEIARRLADRWTLRSVVLWGPGEQALGAEVVSASNGAATLAPPTTVQDLVGLARGARLVVSGDTGPLHIAAAVGVPAVALFGPTNPRRNGPWSRDDITLARYDACDCHYERRCRRPASAWCLGTIGVDDVMAAIERRLRP
jgi:lipopolysaccharide heptosyltransferase I